MSQANASSPAVASDASPEWLDDLLTRSRAAESQDEKRTLLGTLIERYDQISDEDEARKARQAFLRFVQTSPELLPREEVARFLTDSIDPEDFAALDWATPSTVVAFQELLFGFRFTEPEIGEKVNNHTRTLLTQALRQYEKAGEWDKTLELMRLAPTTVTAQSPELLRLRHQAYLHEIRRMRNRRRTLYGYLIAQVLLIVLVFPLLFVYAENGKLQDEIEQATQTDLPEEERTFYTYFDGLYWSVVTAGSIGYGDITPKTSLGRFCAAILGLSGVITVGVIAGLILTWVTPRKLTDD